MSQFTDKIKVKGGKASIDISKSELQARMDNIDARIAVIDKQIADLQTEKDGWVSKKSDLQSVSDQLVS